MLKGEVVKASKDMWTRKTTGDDNIPVDLHKGTGRQRIENNDYIG